MSPLLRLETVLENLPARPDAGSLLAGFVPPPRFAGKSFDEYRPDPRHPSQTAAVVRLKQLAEQLHSEVARGWGTRLRAVFGGGRRGSGIYLDGGFGVGKTHLIAALWNAAPAPKAFLSFDELVYTIGLLGVVPTREAFRGMRLVAVDEWELDDPGNLKLAIAFLRGAVEDGVRVATTSNTVPDELGRGRFDQKSFTTEIEELAAAFETVGITGEDFRHRRFVAEPGREYFVDATALQERAAAAGPRALLTPFAHLVQALGAVHPMRYAAMVHSIDALFLEDVVALPDLFDALRWVHFIDRLYGEGVPLVATSTVALGELFPGHFMTGGYGKKFSRCLSRMEELLSEPVVGRAGIDAAS